ncbi:MAG: sodium:alanine symporter family protein [Oscillospiraceae bacterium]|nr:sodium:alanine symporter family protein [Oscillospiraceae bacterium]
MIDFLNWLNGMLWGLPLIALMIVAGLYFTIRSGAFQFRHFGWIIKHTGGRLTSKESGEGDGMLSPFEAICTAVGGTVGFGNIAGVATAVAAGGPGAVLWMWLTACLGMILKQVEVTLGCYYRSTKENGDTYGGPTYYMQKGLGEERNWGKLWKIPAVIFGIGIFSTFFVTSSNLTASEVVAGAFNMSDLTLGGFTIESEIIVGILLAALTYFITAGGTRGVANTFSKLVPIMSIVYIIMGIAMIIVNIKAVPGAIATILTGAFTGHAAVGGFAGAAVSGMIQTGMARSVYSNEAGWGTSPMIHASAKTRHPVEQGLWGSFEVFFDTFVVCSITALSVILSGTWTSGSTGGALALSAFAEGFGTIGSILLAIIMVIFTVTTSGGWFTYYLAILEHLNLKDGLLSKIIMKLFYATRALPGVLWTIYLVKTGNTGFIWTVVDITSAIPTFVNVFVILLLSGQYFKLLKDYKARYMGIGEVEKGTKLFYEE